MNGAHENDTLDRIHQALAKDGIYIAPSLESEFSPEQLAAIKAHIAAADHPVFVVAHPLRAGDEFSGNATDLLTRLHHAYPEPGVYLSTTDRIEVTQYAEIHLDGRQWGLPTEDDGELPYDLFSTLHHEAPQTLGAAFARLTELVNLPDAKLSEVADRAREQSSTSAGSGYPEQGEGDGIDATGLVVGALVVAVLVTVVVGFLRRRRANRAHVLPPSAMARIRQAHDRTLEKRARDDVLALGESIDAAEITETSNAGSWQAALDHYDAARTVLRRNESPDVLDVVGAIVLSENGHLALAAALGGRAFTPPARCFLNPLHDRSLDTRAVEVDGRSVRVPLCSSCRKALAAKSVPDILDVERGGRPVHYFDTDAEPWAATGYGSLEPDLVRRLHGGS